MWLWVVGCGVGGGVWVEGGEGGWVGWGGGDVCFDAFTVGLQVSRFGSLMAWSGEGLEHLNYMIKQIQRAGCQRGKVANGGRLKRDGTQTRKAPGRVGQAVLFAYLSVHAGDEGAPANKRQCHRAWQGG